MSFVTSIFILFLNTTLLAQPGPQLAFDGIEEYSFKNRLKNEIGLYLDALSNKGVDRENIIGIEIKVIINYDVSQIISFEPFESYIKNLVYNEVTSQYKLRFPGKPSVNSLYTVNFEFKEAENPDYTETFKAIDYAIALAEELSFLQADFTKICQRYNILSRVITKLRIIKTRLLSNQGDELRMPEFEEELQIIKKLYEEDFEGKKNIEEAIFEKLNTLVGTVSTFNILAKSYNFIYSVYGESWKKPTRTANILGFGVKMPVGIMLNSVFVTHAFFGYTAGGMLKYEKDGVPYSPYISSEVSEHVSIGVLAVSLLAKDWLFGPRMGTFINYFQTVKSNFLFKKSDHTNFNTPEGFYIKGNRTDWSPVAYNFIQGNVFALVEKQLYHWGSKNYLPAYDPYVLYQMVLSSAWFLFIDGIIANELQDGLVKKGWLKKESAENWMLVLDLAWPFKNAFFATDKFVWYWTIFAIVDVGIKGALWTASKLLPHAEKYRVPYQNKMNPFLEWKNDISSSIKDLTNGTLEFVWFKNDDIDFRNKQSYSVSLNDVFTGTYDALNFKKKLFEVEKYISDHSGFIKEIHIPIPKSLQSFFDGFEYNLENYEKKLEEKKEANKDKEKAIKEAEKFLYERYINLESFYKKLDVVIKDNPGKSNSEILSILENQIPTETIDVKTFISDFNLIYDKLELYKLTSYKESFDLLLSFMHPFRDNLLSGFSLKGNEFTELFKAKRARNFEGAKTLKFEDISTRFKQTYEAIRKANKSKP